MEVSKGVMAVFVVSGTVAFIANEVHKRLFSDFMKKMEHEIAGSGAKIDHHPGKKRVLFADDVVEPSSNNKEYRKMTRRRLQAREKARAKARPRNTKFVVDLHQKEYQNPDENPISLFNITLKNNDVSKRDIHWGSRNRLDKIENSHEHS